MAEQRHQLDAKVLTAFFVAATEPRFPYCLGAMEWLFESIVSGDLSGVAQSRISADDRGGNGTSFVGNGKWFDFDGG